MKSIIDYSKNYIPFLYFFVVMKKLKYDFLSKKYTDIESITHSYKKRTGNELNLENPLRYTEKLQWMKINYKNPVLTLCADKYAVKQYVKEKGLENILNETIGIYKSPEEIELSKLPEKFILKTSHSSGWNLICTNKQKLAGNWYWWKKVFNVWLKEDYSKYYREWPYKGIQPQIICEKFLGDLVSGLNDYKFYCFNGEVKLIQLNVERYSNHKENFYDENWNHIPLYAGVNGMLDGEQHKPEKLEEMKAISEVLSQDFPHCRVDLFEWNGKIYFGELTFFSGSGYFRMHPDEFDFKMGEWLKLPVNLN
ncbi:MAG: ATP-grasp fold amidoligase family protein [Draconibacterium sp.]